MAREKKDFLAFEISPVHRSTVSDKTNAPTDRRDGRLTAARRSRNEAAERLVKALGHAIASSFSGEHQQNTEDVCRRLLPLCARGRGHARERSRAAEARCVPRLDPPAPVSGAFPAQRGKSLPFAFRVLGFVSAGRDARVRAPRRARRPSPGQRLRRLASLLPCEPIPRLVRPLRPSRASRTPAVRRARRAGVDNDATPLFRPEGLSSRASSPAFDPED